MTNRTEEKFIFFAKISENLLHFSAVGIIL